MAKIEVEKKFAVDENSALRIAQTSDLVNKKTFIDTYFDTQDYRLTRNDIWLRSRTERFELKLPINKSGARIVDQYTELEDESDIRIALNIQQQGTLAEDLQKDGYTPFCKIETTRTTYKNGPFTIDIDYMDFGYTILEIELIVDDPSKIPTATENILSFARSMGLGTNPVRGKVIEYIQRTNPTQYQALVISGTIRESNSDNIKH